MRTLGDTRAPARALAPVSGTCRRSAGAGVCVHPRRLDYIIIIIFLYRLLFAADGGERRAGRAAWGMGVEGSWTPINPEKKKFGRAASRLEGLEGVASWRECAVRWGPVRGELRELHL